MPGRPVLEFHDGFAAADAAAVVDDHVHDVHRLLLRRAGLFEVAGHEGVVDVLVGAERVVVGAAHAAARADGHAAEQHFVEPVEDVEAAAVETDAFDHLHEVVRRELDAVQVGNLFRAFLQEVDHRQVDARHRGNVVGVEGQRSACGGDGFVEGHQFFDRAGFEVEWGDGAYGVYPQSGGMAGQFDAVGLTGAAHVGDDEDTACYGFGPRFEHALALGDGHRGAFARRAADEDAVGPFGDEFVGVGLDLRKIDCARFVERREDGGNESG